MPMTPRAPARENTEMTEEMADAARSFGEVRFPIGRWALRMPILTPNVGLTGAAPVYGAASSDRRERG